MLKFLKNVISKKPVPVDVDEHEIDDDDTYGINIEFASERSRDISHNSNESVIEMDFCN